MLKKTKEDIVLHKSLPSITFWITVKSSWLDRGTRWSFFETTPWRRFGFRVPMCCNALSSQHSPLSEPKGSSRHPWSLPASPKVFPEPHCRRAGPSPFQLCPCPAIDSCWSRPWVVIPFHLRPALSLCHWPGSSSGLHRCTWPQAAVCLLCFASDLFLSPQIFLMVWTLGWTWLLAPSLTPMVEPSWPYKLEILLCWLVWWAHTKYSLLPKR